MNDSLERVQELAEQILDEIATAKTLLMECAGESPRSLTNSTQIVLKGGK